MLCDKLWGCSDGYDILMSHGHGLRLVRYFLDEIQESFSCSTTANVQLLSRQMDLPYIIILLINMFFTRFGRLLYYINLRHHASKKNDYRVNTYINGSAKRFQYY